MFSSNFRGQTLPLNMDLNASLRGNGKRIPKENSTILTVNSSSNSSSASSTNSKSVKNQRKSNKIAAVAKRNQKYAPDLGSSIRSTRSNFLAASYNKEDQDVSFELLRKNDSSQRQNLSTAGSDVSHETIDTVSSSDTTMVEVKNGSCWGKTKRLYHFLMETQEYKDPQMHGWRIKFRRIFLTMGVLAFTYQTIHTAVTTQNYSSKVTQVIVGVSRVFSFRFCRRKFRISWTTWGRI